MAEQRLMLDTSALLAWLMTEPGAERVRSILQSAADDVAVFVAWPSLVELYSITARLKGDESALEQHAALKQLPVTIIQEVNEPLLIDAARLKSRFTLSFADSLIAAMAQQWGATLVHKDPEYAPLANELALEALPHKPKVK